MDLVRGPSMAVFTFNLQMDLLYGVTPFAGCFFWGLRRFAVTLFTGYGRLVNQVGGNTVASGTILAISHMVVFNK